MRAPRLVPCLVLAGALLPACGGDPSPPPKVAREGAGVQVRRVATKWSETIEEDGFLQSDPNGVSRFRVITKRTLTLGEGAAATLRVERDETFETRVGSFRCKVKGDVPAVAAYVWQAGDPEVRLTLPGASLPRTCDPPAFPVATKELGASTMVLLLRSDRLIGKTSSRDRTVMLPLP